MLDRAIAGPMWLTDPQAAQIVVDRILFGSVAQSTSAEQNDSDGDVRDDVRLKPDVRYELFAYCVMANHVHVVLTPLWQLKDLMQGIKGYTSFRINQLRDERGRTFWQDESYDHWCRNEEEFLRVIQYVEQNPVAAGLCSKPEAWPWSSARWRPTWKTGEAFRMELLPADEQQRLLTTWQPDVRQALA